MNMLGLNLALRRFLVSGLEFPNCPFHKYGEFSKDFFYLKSVGGGRYILTFIGYGIPDEIAFVNDLICKGEAKLTNRFEICHIPNFDFDLWGITAKCSNEFYDPRKANDGGGYWQYSGECHFAINDASVDVKVNNSSCGYFGTRYSATIRVERYASISFGKEEGDGQEVQEEEYSFYWGSMIGKKLSDSPHLRDAAKSLGIRVSEARSLILECLRFCDTVAWSKQSNKVFQSLFPKELEK